MPVRIFVDAGFFFVFIVEQSELMHNAKEAVSCSALIGILAKSESVLVIMSRNVLKKLWKISRLLAAHRLISFGGNLKKILLILI